jgi:predicted DNA-binding transcriptional regulator YafY
MMPGRKSGTHTQAVRVVRLLRLLERDGLHWYTDLAATLKVGERTVRRDMHALREAGEPVMFKNGGAWVER